MISSNTDYSFYKAYFRSFDYIVEKVINNVTASIKTDISEEETKDETPLEKLPFKKELWAEIKGERTSVIRELLLLVVGAVVIAFGADFLVDNGTYIANKIGIPQTVIALTFVALGTSLPELVTAITALVKGHSSLSLGNIIGANLFNLVLIFCHSYFNSLISLSMYSLLQGYFNSYLPNQSET